MKNLKEELKTFWWGFGMWALVIGAGFLYAMNGYHF